MARRTAFALAGPAGSNAHGSGFLAAAQQVARERGVDSGLPGLEMISCTSGAIVSTASYLRSEDLRADLPRAIDDAEQVRRRWWLTTLETPRGSPEPRGTCPAGPSDHGSAAVGRARRHLSIR